MVYRGGVWRMSIYVSGFILFYALSFEVYAQNEVKIDSLQNLLSTELSVDDRLHVFDQILDEWILVNYDSADFWSNKYYDLALSNGDKLDLAYGINLQGLVFDYRGDYIKARDYYRQALDLRTEAGDKRLMANSLNNIGITYYYSAYMEKAAEYYLQALALREELNDSTSMGQSYNNLGVVFKYQKNYEKAIEYYTKAAEIKRDLNQTRSLMYTMMNIGGLYLAVEEYDQALAITDEAIQVSQQLNDLATEAILYINKAEAHNGLEDFDAAVNAVRRGIQLNKRVGEISHELRGWNVLTNVYLTSGYKSGALEAVNTFISKPDESKDEEILLNHYQLASNAYYQNGDYKKAYEFGQLYRELNSELIEKANNQTMLEMTTKFEVDQKEQEIKLLNSQNQIQSISLAQAKLTRKYLIIFAILVVIIAVVIYVSYINRQKINKILVQQNDVIKASLDEKELLLKEIHHRVKNNLQIISSLLNIQSRNTEDEQASQAIKESQSRVKSMALIHQSLYRKDNATSVRVKDYLEQLSRTISESFAISDRILLKLDIDDIELDVDTIIPMGLIINELITNSVKHAFEEQDNGKISISLNEDGDSLKLVVTDDGSNESTGTSGSDSFGLKLVETLSKKLEAEMQVKRDEGTSVSLTIRNYKAAS